MPRRKKSLPSDALGGKTLENITNFQNQIMTRSRTKALEMLSPLSNTRETAPGPAKNGRQLRIGKGPPKNVQRNLKEPESHSSGAGLEELSESRAAAEATPNNDDELVLEQYKALRRLLGTKCLDVVDRMKLNYVPRCIQRRSFCRSHHWKPCAPVRLAETDIKSKAMHFLDEERYAHFIKFIEDMCTRNEFPGADVIIRIWELILIIHVPEHENYSSIWVIDECVFLFEKIISIFPPCWSAIREAYAKLLTDPISDKNILPNRNFSVQTILEFLIYKLSEIMKEEPKQDQNESKEEIFNFHEWEKKNMSKRDFETFSREQKLDRLFIVLHQVVKILEMDLAVWIPQHVGNPKKHLSGAEKPLIYTVFGLDQYTRVTNLVKRTLEVYVSCICFSYPPNQIAHLTRLVSLVAVVMNLCERSTTKELKYPNTGQVTKDFVMEIYKAIDALVGINVEYILLVIKEIKIPFVKYLLIDEFLFKLDGHRQEMCAKKIIDIFRKQSWLKCEQSNESKNIQFSTRPVADFKYPIIPKKIPKPSSCVIYREQYLNLLLAALEAYCDFYAIKDIAKLFVQNKPKKCSMIEIENPRKVIVYSEGLDVSRIEDDIDALAAQMDLKQQLPSESEEPQYFEGIHIDANVMKQYRNELKCLMILRKNIPVLREKHGSVFDKFYNYTQQEIFGGD